ncbi:MAG: alpha/beta hydrolase family protein, partial [bacterium]
MSENLVVLGDQDLSGMVFDHIVTVAEELFERADERRRALATGQDVQQHQRYVRETFTAMLGGFPERTPLNARPAGTLRREGYRVEKLLFESRPFFYVTANLYLPERRDAAPAVLVPCGHAPQGKAHETYQALAQGLAKKGFVALVYDPIGQGERSQYWEPLVERSRLGLCSPEHDYAGTQALLVGRHFAGWRVWDAIRAVDYLVGRDEVDVARIGCVGCSGGGTVTTYLFALDERIRAAVPVCYVTSREAWLATGAFADAEQVQDGAIARGIDHCDLLIAGAPRALRIGAARGDYFPIEGTRRAFDAARRAYALLQAPECIDLAEAEGEHGLSQPLREAAYGWCHQWLGHPAEDASEPAVQPERPEELWCAPGGQVHALGSRTVFSFTRDEALSLPPTQSAMTSRGDAELWQDELRGALRDLLRCPASSGAPFCYQHGAFFRGSVGIERVSFQSERGITVPGLLFVPEREGRWPGILYVHEGGKEAEAGPRGTAQMLAGEGNVVLAIDVRGVGETASQDSIRGQH